MNAQGPPHRDDDLVVSRSLRIPRHELEVSFSASGGPGGQHANRSNTRVELRFDVTASIAFSAAQRERIVGRIGHEIRIVADDERSQLRNRTIAERRLVERLQEALRVDRPRRPTKPTRGSKERRIAGKQRRGEIKRGRSKPSRDD